MSGVWWWTGSEQLLNENYSAPNDDDAAGQVNQNNTLKDTKTLWGAEGKLSMRSDVE